MLNKKNEMKEALAKLSSEIRDIDLSDRSLVVWGAGNTSCLAQESFNRYGIDPLFYVDENEEKQKGPFYGHKVLSPDGLSGVDDPIVLISSGNVGFTDDIRSKLSRTGLRNLTLDEYFFGKNADRLIRAADMLSDDRSVEVYCSMVLNRLNNRLPDTDTISDDQYFVLPEFKKIAAGDVFVNIGAYKGEEIEKYLEHCSGKGFGKIISFEPDRDNFTEISALTDRLRKKWNIGSDRIRSVMAAVSDVTKTSFFRSEGERSLVDETATNTGSSVDIYSLDDLMPGERIDLLKADIESFELRMLHGAEKLIVSNVPKIAVSIYHSPADLFDIIEYLSDLDIGYRFSVRHHSKKFEDTVLYAYTDRERE